MERETGIEPATCCCRTAVSASKLSCMRAPAAPRDRMATAPDAVSPYRAITGKRTSRQDPASPGRRAQRADFSPRGRRPRPPRLG